MPLRHRALMTGGVMLAKATLPPCGIITDARGWSVRGDDTLRLGHDAQGGLGVVMQAFLIELIGVLVDREVKGAIQPRKVHLALHLRPMLRLGFGDAVTLEREEGFLAMGLEFADMPGAGRFGQPDRHRIHAAAEMPACIA